MFDIIGFRLDGVGIFSTNTYDSCLIEHFIKMVGLTESNRDLERALCHMEIHRLISKKVLFQAEPLIYLVL
jgi:hypothetical protein